MRKKVLIIRSVSFQQLDQNLAALVKEFPPESFELHLLTHGHGLERARTYEALSVIIDYERRGNFSPFHRPAALKKTALKHQEYDVVIVPVTNKTGLGFLNVLTLAMLIPSRKIMVCNMVSELRRVSRAGIVGWGVASFLFSLFAGAAAVVMAVATAPYLLIRLMFRGKGRRKEHQKKHE